ncbi:type II toxin-antitoxin system VapC family toxin [Candidatus Woesearchaeota archaeon]|nr:type II toxin-antitoxin system VapC family toxin [Candidatus Woesearchaeota archaeon]
MAILIDASVFCAYANSRDVHHARAQGIFQEIISGKHGTAITTDYLFDETVSVINRKSSRENAVEAGKLILGSEILMAKIDNLCFQKSWELFQGNKDLSFTDCTNVAFMRIFGIKKIATFDRGFRSVADLHVIT